MEVRHVLAPFAASLVATTAVLIAYTFADPPTWEREADVTFGTCLASPWFQLVLDLLLLIAVAISAWKARLTRGLPEDISDSKRVWQTLTAHLAILICKCWVGGECTSNESWDLTTFDAVGIVSIVILSLVENITFRFLSQLFIYVSSSVTSIAFLVVPKMYFVYRFNKTGEMPTGLQLGRTHISGISSPPNNTPVATSQTSFSNNGVDPKSVGSVVSGSLNTSAIAPISV